MEDVYVVQIDEADETWGVSNRVVIYRKYEDAKKYMQECIDGFKSTFDEWDNDDEYEWEESPTAFEWWESGNHIGNHYHISVAEYRVL